MRYINILISFLLTCILAISSLLHADSLPDNAAIDAREKAPLKSHRDMYLDKDGNVIPNISLQGPMAAGIPGISAALVHIASQYSKLPLNTSLEPAIRIARHGYSIDETYCRLQNSVCYLGQNEQHSGCSQ